MKMRHGRQKEALFIVCVHVIATPPFSPLEELYSIV
jgi:hypothetical protein